MAGLVRAGADRGKEIIFRPLRHDDGEVRRVGVGDGDDAVKVRRLSCFPVAHQARLEPKRKADAQSKRQLRHPLIL